MDNLLKNTPIQLKGGWHITGFRLSGSNIRNVTLVGLDIDTNYREIEDYFQRFGAVIIQKQEKYCTYSTSKWKGKMNGDRTVLMNLEGTTVPLGTYHLIDGVRVCIHYRGCVPTCGRCLSTPEYCPGRGYSKNFNEVGGQKVDIKEHVNWLADEHVRRLEQNRKTSNDNMEVKSESVTNKTTAVTKAINVIH